MTNGTSTAGGGSNHPGGSGGSGAKAIDKIAADIAANLSKQLGDHPHLDRAAVVKAVQDKIASLAAR
jgi:hypothetical protein